MKRSKHSSSIQKRIVCLTLSCLFGMCIIISVVSFYIFQTYLQHSLILSTETSLQLLSDNINGRMDSVYHLVQFCQTNSEIASYIETGSSPFKTYDRLSEEYNNNASSNYIPRLAIVRDSDFLQIVNPTYSSSVDLSAKLPTLSFFDQLAKAPSYDFTSGFCFDPFYKNSTSVLPIIRPLTYQFSSKQGGYLYLEISSDLFTTLLARYSLAEDSQLYLRLGEHIYTFENDTFIDSSDLQIADESTDSSTTNIQIQHAQTSSGTTLTLVSAPLDMPNCYICQSISQTERFHQFILLLTILFFTLIGIIAIGLILVFILNKMINVPVAKLRAKMIRISNGDFSRDSTIEWNHELGDIGRGINDLSENVDLLMTKRLEDEKQKKDLEYQMLQSQINPHFIYNTLNSIKWMAEIQGSSGISEITTALSRLLKSISKGTSLLIPIREELTLIQNYFTIQSYRYGGTVSMQIMVEEESIYDCDILKFTLQPLVENAIFHGIEPKGTTGNITIHAFYEYRSDNDTKDICIQVTDDGIGMSHEKATLVLAGKDGVKADFFKKIGVSNVHQRLQYEFGDTYGISIDSMEGIYTTMTIRLPQRIHNPITKEAFKSNV